MVDCGLLDLGRINNDARFRIIEYVLARDLVITPNLISMIRSGKRKVTEDPLSKALMRLSHEELTRYWATCQRPSQLP